MPYANLDDPQTLNLYSYGFNNPLGIIDPDGHLPCGGGDAQITIVVTPNGSSMSQSPDCDNLPDVLPGPHQQTAINLRQTQNTPSPSKPVPPSDGEITCAGYGRSLAGNPNYVKHTPKGGAFAPWRIHPSAGTGAVDPTKFGYQNAQQMHGDIGNISGSIGNTTFSSVSDVIGGTSPLPGTPIRDAEALLNPGRVVVDVPGGKDNGIVGAGGLMVGGDQLAIIKVPASQGCPAFTERVQ